ncbi:MAG: glutamate N-acetyltransferase/amino-acid N-acetyltransferase [Oceanicoccus sp.]|jgi:glutamate N-acetyltransferase/amino-acid N-acetyltransferase
MAVGNSELPILFPVAGFKLGTTSAGIKHPGRHDLVVMEICDGGSVAGVFTQNAFCAAPVQIAKSHLSNVSSRYFVVNTGNANAGTGEQGLADSLATCTGLGTLASCAREKILPFSTGVIGELLPVKKIVAALPQALAALSVDGWTAAATGIMTTDTRPKAASRQFDFLGQSVTVTGIAKGAGMIKPNMATMLAYVATDASVNSEMLNKIIVDAVNLSFNRITIDGDTSTNDACMLVATGQLSNSMIDSEQHDLYQPLQDCINSVCIDLAQGLVRDGEGASKFVSVIVNGGTNEKECLQVAYVVAESPLVKTALFASDPNWGRLLMAIGRAGVDGLDVDIISVSIGDALIAENGCRAASYTEEKGAVVMAEEEISITIDLSRGGASATVWTSDLSHEYVRINAEYRT